MQPTRLLTPAALAVAAVLLAGCSGKSKAPEQAEFTGTPFVVTEYTPDLREHHSSWGHSGRGGAALRKPTYQPVLGSPDMLETRSGKLHPELQPKQPETTVSIAVPPGLVAGTCNQTSEAEAGVEVFALGEPVTGKTIVTLANNKGSVDQYIQVRNKLCRGAERLTYEEWEILVMGTPKDVPLKLQPNQTKQKVN